MFVRHVARGSACSKRVHSGITRAAIPQHLVVGTRLIGTFFLLRGVVPNESLVVYVWPVGHSHGICSATYTGHSNQRPADLGAGGLQPSKPIFGGEECYRRTIRHHTDIQTGQGPGHHGRVAHVFDRVAMPLLCVRVVVSVGMVLDRNSRHLFDGCAKLLHVARHHHGVVSGIESADRIVPGNVRGKGDEFVAFPGLDAAHSLKSIRHA